MQQRTDDWFKARLGKATASRIADVIAETRTGWGASRKNYAAELVAERLSGEPASSFVNAAMLHGIETEPEARDAYELAKVCIVNEVGFIEHPSILMTGASPDGFVGSLGLIEIKCPNSATHIETLLTKTIPGKYVTQMMWQMACTGRLWCDFVSYDPRLPKAIRLFVKRVERDDEVIADLEKKVAVFLTEVAETESFLREMIEHEEVG